MEPAALRFFFSLKFLSTKPFSCWFSRARCPKNLEICPYIILASSIYTRSCGWSLTTRLCSLVRALRQNCRATGSILASGPKLHFLQPLLVESRSPFYSLPHTTFEMLLRHFPKLSIANMHI